MCGPGVGSTMLPMNARRLLPALLVALLVPAASAAAAPINDDFADATDLGGASQVSQWFTLSGATTESLFEPNHFSYEYGHTVWFKWTPAATGGVHVKACDNISAKIKVYTGSTLGGLSAVPIGEGGTNGCDAWHRFMAYKGTTYRIVVDHGIGATDYTGTVKIDQGTTKPAATFPGWAGTTPKTFKSPLRTTTWNDPLDAMYGNFDCTIDGVSVYCDENGASLKDLAHGPHVFKARARDHYGNWQDGWSTRYFNVDAVGPTTTMQWAGPPKQFDAPPSISWTTNEPGVTFLCEVVGHPEIPAGPCTSPWQAPELQKDTNYTLRVYSKDPYGNAGNYATASWRVVTAAAPPAPAPAPTPAPASAAAPVTTTAATTTNATQLGAPAGPCTPKVTALTRSQRTIRTRGMRVRIANTSNRFCVVDLALRAGKRSLAKQVRPVGAGRTIVVTLKPRLRVARSARIRLVSSAR